MFVRKKKNRSGVISVQVIDKSSGSYKLVKTIGSSADPKTVEKLYLEGQIRSGYPMGWVKRLFDQYGLTKDEIIK